MLELAEMRACAGAFDPVSLTHPWTHPDPAVDALQAEVAALVGVRLNAARADVFARVWETRPCLRRRGGCRPAGIRSLLSRAAIPYLNEPWYC